MSDSKDFLSRWSQRKLKPEAPATPEKDARLPADASHKISAPAAPEPAFDITTLPSLDSIAANSDIRAFLQHGVPESLRHAALRRAWSADPAIRDFVGLSENAWDFNAPDSIPGFGPLNADQVRQAAAWLFRDQTETTAQTPASDSEIGESDQNSSETTQVAAASSDLPEQSTPSDQQPPDAAMQHDREGEAGESLLPLRRHGGALPE
jgi:hypothetical protein